MLLITLWPLPLTQGFAPMELPPAEPRSELGKVSLAPPVKKISFRTERQAHKPKIAFVVDDLGDNWEKLQVLLHIDAPLTLAFLPNTPFSAHAMDRAPRLGKEVFLHVPMEPDNPDEINAPSFLLTGMSEAQVYKILDRELQRLPQCRGINNHMGSRLTKDRVTMAMVFKYLRERNLSFLDSRTTNESVAFSVAQEMGVPAAIRDVFLDHDPRRKSIDRQFKLLRQIARHKGYAVAIGHPHAATLTALRRQVRLLRAEGFEIVPVSKLM